MAIEKERIDRLLADDKTPEDLIGDSGLLKQLTKALYEPWSRDYRPPGARKIGSHRRQGGQCP